MTEPIKVVVAGVGAFGQKHLDACKLIDGVEVVSIVGRQLAPTEEVARKYGVPHATTDLAEALARPGVTAAILCTPTQLHAAQVIQCLERRQARAGRDSARRLHCGRASRRRSREALGARLHGGTHAPIQSVASMAASSHRRRRSRSSRWTCRRTSSVAPT